MTQPEGRVFITFNILNDIEFVPKAPVPLTMMASAARGNNGGLPDIRLPLSLPAIWHVTTPVACHSARVLYGPYVHTGGNLAMQSQQDLCLW
jgi:hypothetical protein